MTDAVGNGVPANARGLGNKQILILMSIDALREHCPVGLVLVNGAQVGAQHPHGGVEPLQGGEQVGEQHVPRMSEAYVCPLMSEYSGILFFVVATIHDYIVHPAEWRHVCATGHTDHRAVLLWMLLAAADEQNDFRYRREGVAHRCGHAGEEHHGQRYLPPRRLFFRRLYYGCRHARFYLGHGHHHRPMQRDDAQRQHKRGNRRRQQHDAVEPVERLTAEQQPIEHVEHGYERSHLQVVDEKVSHSLFA